MTETPQVAAYFNMIEQTEQQTVEALNSTRLTGTFVQAFLEAMQVGMSHQEVKAAAIIGHHRGSKRENTSPDYSFVIAQLDYWRAVYEEAEQYWLDRYRGDGDE